MYLLSMLRTVYGALACMSYALRDLYRGLALSIRTGRVKHTRLTDEYYA